MEAVGSRQGLGATQLALKRMNVVCELVAVALRQALIEQVSLASLQVVCELESLAPLQESMASELVSVA